MLWKPSRSAVAVSAYFGRSASVALTKVSARVCSAAVTPATPPRSIGFVGSYGFGLGSVVGAGTVDGGAVEPWVAVTAPLCVEPPQPVAIVARAAMATTTELPHMVPRTATPSR